MNEERGVKQVFGELAGMLLKIYPYTGYKLSAIFFERGRVVRDLGW